MGEKTKKEEIITFYEKLQEEFKRLTYEIELITHQLETLPEGKLIVTNNHGRFKWYQKEEKHLTYIPKCQRSIAEKLAERKYLAQRQQELIQERNDIQSYLLHFEEKTSSADDMLLDRRYQELLAPSFKLSSQILEEWKNSPFQQSTNHPEHLKHRSCSGNIVRSKSEVIIDTALFHHRLAFRYECMLQLEDFIFYPDFTIMHPESLKIIYWEHFGLMDQPSYARKAYEKLQFFNSNNIIPTINLITTFETKEHPLTPDLVEKTIQQYFFS